MSAITSASPRVFASVAVRASGAARPRVAVPAPTVSAPAKSARLGAIRVPGRGAKLVVRADGEGLDRDAPELQEKFAIIGSGEHECQSCMYTYVPKNGDDFYPVAAGTQFRDLPDDWRCPTCGAEKSKFKNMGKEVAGFEQNQGYGLGTNSMTGGEKSVLIYGALALFFLFFISGYLLD